uniref:hypothetical protein n=1 Tax=uncultured Sphingomonas sp. TaxID=158754 RepID=UPI0035CBECE8
MVTAGDIIGGGFRLVRERIGSVAIWTLLCLAMNVAVLYAMRPFMADILAAQAAQASGAAPNPAAMLSGLGQVFGVYLLLLLVLLVVYTAALRAAVRPAENGFAYLRIGMDELRMLAVAVILAVGLFLLYIVLVMITALIGAVVGFMARDAIVPITVLLVCAVLGALIFVQVRFSLAFALTVLRGKIIIGEAWTLSRGRFWTLFGAYFVLGLIVFVSAMAIFTISAGPYLAEIGKAGLSPAAVNAVQQHQLERQFGAITPLTVVTWVLGAVLGTLWITLAAGATGQAASGLTDDAFADIGAIYE